MKRIAPHIIAILIGCVIFAISFVLIDVIGDAFFDNLYYSAFGSEWLQSQTNWPIVPDYRRVGQIVEFGYPLTIAVMTVFLFWNGWPKLWGRVLLYISFFIFIAPITYINYKVSDQWLNVYIQALFNIFVAFVSLIIILWLRRVQALSIDLMAFQSLSILLLSSFGVALPLFYSCVFFGFATKLLKHEQIQAINDNIPLVVAGGVGAIITFISQLDKLRKEAS